MLRFIWPVSSNAFEKKLGLAAVLRVSLAVNHFSSFYNVSDKHAGLKLSVAVVLKSLRRIG